ASPLVVLKNPTPDQEGGTGEGLPHGTYLGGSERNTREHQTNEFARERSGGRVPLKREPPDRASASAGQRGSIPSGPAKKLPGVECSPRCSAIFCGSGGGTPPFWIAAVCRSIASAGLIWAACAAQ